MAKLYYLAVIPLLYMAITHLLHVFYFAGAFCDSKVSLKGKTVIVTGANTGIGKTTALDMAERGARVIMACRSRKRAMPAVEEITSKTGNKDVVFMQLDLASFASVNEFSEAFLKAESRLDILINNAGMISQNAAQHNEDGIELTLAINHLGPFLLTQNLLELLIKSGPGSRIINVSSLAHHFANPAAFLDLDGGLAADGVKDFTKEAAAKFVGSGKKVNPLGPNFIIDIMPASFQQSIVDQLTEPRLVRYSNSKLANVLFTKELARRLEGKGVTTYSLHPGVIRTEIGIDRNTGEHFDSFGKMLAKLPDFLNPILFFFKTLEGGAQTTICCAVSEDLGADSGLYYSDCEAVPVVREEMNDDFTSKFYDWSDEVIQRALKSKA